MIFVLTKNLFQFQISVFPGHWNVAKHFILEHLGGRSWSFVEMKQVAVGLWSPLAWEEPKREPPRLIVLTQHLPSQLISAGPSTLLLRLLLRLLVRLLVRLLLRLPQNIFDLVSGQQR